MEMHGKPFYREQIYHANDIFCFVTLCDSLCWRNSNCYGALPSITEVAKFVAVDMQISSPLLDRHASIAAIALIKVAHGE
jgi:hypothetical protein